MVIGRDISDADLAPVCVGSNQIECITEFRYLGSIIDTSGRCSIYISSRIAAASRAFGSLRKPVSSNHHLSVRTKKNIFNACVVTILLYGAECWVPLQADIQRLSKFYMQSVRTVLGITRLDAWQERTSNDQLLDTWGDKRLLAVRIHQRQLEWLGHVARMPPERIPKILLFGLLPSRCPPGGPRKRWKHCISADLKALNAVEGWYDLADSRSDWRRMYRCFEPEPPTPMSIAKYVIGTSLAHQMRSVTNARQNGRNRCVIRLALANVVSANVGAAAPVDWLPIGAITDLLPTSSTPATQSLCSAAPVTGVSSPAAAWPDTSATARNEGQCRKGPTSRLSALAKGTSDYVTI
ncbi:uncharacterized protein LOC135810929 [Sycon ciliatum]|uniref:uncharacterized protein LOC135810929 n=1 Tax=Sycon ciliatum TaxID=27933 RepID=UPI0031F660ED